MKTYAEKKRRKSFDWNKALNGAISMKEWSKLSDLSESWVTCACGNQCAAIPRNNGGIPIDNILAKLGNRFHFEICNQNAKGAKEILAKIEKRSSILINQIRKDLSEC